MTASDSARLVSPAIAAIMADPAIAGLHMSGAPVIIAGGLPPQVVYASKSAANVFGSHDIAVLSARIFGGGQPGSQRLVQLASRTQAAPPRLERLRFFIGGTAEMLTLQCRSVVAASGEVMFVLAAVGVRPALLRAAVPPAMSLSGQSAGPAPQDAAAEPGPAAAAAISHPASSDLAREAPPVLPAPPALAAAEAGLPRAPEADAAEMAGPRPAFDAARAAARPVRFSWRSDAQGCIDELPLALIEAAALPPEAVSGRKWEALASGLKLEGAEKLLQALTARTSFAGIETAWPVPGTGEWLPVMLGAAPVMDKNGDFAFHRGFGQMQFDRVRPAPEIAPPPAGLDAAPIAAPLTGAEPPPSAAGADAETQPAERHGLVDLEPSDPFKEEAVSQAAVSAVQEFQPSGPGTAEQPPAQQPETAEADSAQPAEAPSQIAGPAVPVPGMLDADRGPAGFPGQALPAVEPSLQEDAKIVRLRPLQGHLKLASQTENPEPAPVATAKLVPEVNARAMPAAGLSTSERAAFSEIARSLTAKIQNAAPEILQPGSKATVAPSPAPVTAAAAPRQSAPSAAEPEAAEALPPPESDGNAARALEHIPLGILICRDGEPLYANHHLLDMLGYADSRAFAAASGFVRMFKGRQPESFDPPPDGGALPLVTLAGEVVMAETRLQTLPWNGRPASLLTFRRSVADDGNARLQTLEMELRQHETQARELHAILDTATDGVAILDENGRILSLNRSAEALFGLDQNEVAGAPFTVLIARDQEHLANDYFQGIKTNGVASVLNDGREMLGRARHGGAIPLFMTLGPVGPGANPKFCAILRDLTQWKKVEGELSDARREAERASQLKSDFLAKISHEIRTPLNAILGFTEVMVEERFGAIGNDRYKDYLKDIHTSGTHVMSLVNDLLDLSKIEAGKMELEFSSVDANRIVAESVSIMQPQAATARIIVRQSLAPRLPNIVADERSLRQIVLNLLSNAVKFNEAGGQVIVSTALTDAGHAVIRIRDTGVGMNEADIQSALEPFKQLQTARRQTGTGLGLPLTRALAEANRASFTIKSKKNEGTLVEVAFPPTRVLAE